DRYEIEPWLAGGFARSTMTGVQNGVAREETAMLAAVRGGVWGRRRFGMWSIGAEVSVEAMLGTPTYTKPDQARALVFEVPSFRGDSTLGRWCQTIATRIAYLAIARRRPPSIDLDLVEDVIAGDCDALRVAQAREAARRLYTALDRLDPKQRIAFALAVIDQR